MKALERDVAERVLPENVLAPTYPRSDTLFVSGSGAWLVDDQGRRFLDMTSGIAVNALGHAAPEIAETLREHADGLVHVSNLYHTAPAIELARELVRLSFAEQVFFCNSGAEANEGAFKIARLAAASEDKRDIVYFEGAFHGRTFGALAATDRPDYREPFEPLPNGFRRARWNHSEALESIGQRTAAVIVEPIQGEAGVRVPSHEWLCDLRARCDEVNATLIFDEVQCGLGRTGSLFAYEQVGVVPDILTLAKPLAGGLPMGAVLLGQRAAAAVRPGCHGTTFGGGPLVASVALRVLQTVADKTFLSGVRSRSTRLRQALRRATGLDVRGRGLMAGVQVPDARRLHELAFEAQLLVVPAGDSTLRFLPPLNVDEADIDEAAVRFGSAYDRLRRES